MFAATLILVLTLGALRVARTLAARRIERESARKLPRDARGIIVGAEPFELTTDGSRAVLLLHGFGDTPQTLRRLADHLHSRGWTARAPLLPGHGRTLREFAASTAAEWIDCARQELQSLEDRYDVVALCGLSMGGAISLIIAAESPEVPAMVLMAPYVGMSTPIRLVVRVHHLFSLFTVYLAGRSDRSIHDPVESARALGYGYSTPRLLNQLARVVARAAVAAPEVRAPTLVIQSREDNRIAPAT